MKHIITTIALLLCTIALAASNTNTKAPVVTTDAITIPQLINYQGKLTDGSGNLINGTRDMTFRLYDGVTQFWTEDQTGVSIVRGQFNVLLGSATPITTIPEGGVCSLEVVVAGVTIAPKTPLVSVPYAWNAAGLTSNQEGICRANAGNLLNGSDRGSHVNFGVACSTDGLDATVGGGAWNHANADGATVSGGQYNGADGRYGVVGGGQYNRTYGRWGGALSGQGNVGGDHTLDTGAVVAGGWSNSANAQYAFVGGGYYNTAGYSCATVGGGSSNGANGSAATVGGGWGNSAEANCATVGGGGGNSASGDWATVAGGGPTSRTATSPRSAEAAIITPTATIASLQTPTLPLKRVIPDPPPSMARSRRPATSFVAARCQRPAARSRLTTRLTRRTKSSITISSNRRICPISIPAQSCSTPRAGPR